MLCDLLHKSLDRISRTEKCSCQVVSFNVLFSRYRIVPEQKFTVTNNAKLVVDLLNLITLKDKVGVC